MNLNMLKGLRSFHQMNLNMLKGLRSFYQMNLNMLKGLRSFYQMNLNMLKGLRSFYQMNLNMLKVLRSFHQTNHNMVKGLGREMFSQKRSNISLTGDDLLRVNQAYRYWNLTCCNRVVGPKERGWTSSNALFDWSRAPNRLKGVARCFVSLWTLNRMRFPLLGDSDPTNQTPSSYCAKDL